MFVRLSYVAFAALGLVIGWVGGSRGGSWRTQLTFLDVGQGDSAVFQHRGSSVLIDCGPRSASFDAGARYVAPGLVGLGVRKIDLLLLTHPDSDHIGGLAAVSERFRIDRVAAPRQFRDHPAMLDALRVARIDPSSVVWVQERRTVKLGEFALRLDAPSNAVEDNAGSLVAYLRGPGGSALLAGDLPAANEPAILARPGPWRSDVLKASHHGSADGTGEDLLAATSPGHVVFSSGKNNSHGHPRQETLRRAARTGAKLWRTDQSGNLAFVPSASGFSLAAE